MALGNTPRTETQISLEASKSYALGMRFIMTDGSPVDLTDAIVRFVMTEPPQRGSTEVLTSIAVYEDPTTGLCMFKFQAADLTLDAGSYSYDITLVPASGYSTPLVKGTVEIGSNTDLDDTNVYTDLNLTSDITVTIEDGDVIVIEVERVDGLYLVVQAMIDRFAAEMEEEVAKAAGYAQDALTSANLAEAANNEMQAWLDNAGYPFWKGTQAEYDLLVPKREILYMIVDG